MWLGAALVFTVCGCTVAVGVGVMAADGVRLTMLPVAIAFVVLCSEWRLVRFASLRGGAVVLAVSGLVAVAAAWLLFVMLFKSLDLEKERPTRRDESFGIIVSISLAMATIVFMTHARHVLLIHHWRRAVSDR